MARCCASTTTARSRRATRNPPRRPTPTACPARAPPPAPASRLCAVGCGNPYGLAFHPATGVPYITENGEVGHDEVNRIVAGGNYGNPVAEGYAHKPGFIDPVWETGVGRQAPSGA